MPPAASHASALHSQHQSYGLGARPANAPPKQAASPFSLLLDEAEAAKPPKDDGERTQPGNHASPPPRKSATGEARSDHDAPQGEASEAKQQPDSVAPATAPRDDETAETTENAEVAFDTIPATVLTEGSDDADEADVIETALSAAAVEAAASPVPDIPVAAPTIDGAEAPQPLSEQPVVAAPVAPTPTSDSGAAAPQEIAAAAQPAALDAAVKTGGPGTDAGGVSAPADEAAQDVANASSLNTSGSNTSDLNAQKLNASHLNASNVNTSDESTPLDADTSTSTGASAPASAERAIKAETGAAHVPHDEAPAPAEPAPQEKPHPAAAHSDRAPRTEAPKPDELTRSQASALGNDTALNAKPAAEHAHTPFLAQLGERFASLIPATAQSSASAASAPVPIAGLAVEIAARAQAGSNRFEIRLDPPELGRIDVRLDVDRSGQVTSRLVVERAETLEMLRREVGDLERALQQAGLKTGDNGLQFALRDQAFADRDDQSETPGAARAVLPDADLAPVEALQQSGYGHLRRMAGGIDIRV